MIKKFECKNCLHQFEADDQGTVICPLCNSDNVEPAHRHIPAVVWKVMASIILIMLACAVILFLVSRCESAPDAPPPGLVVEEWDPSDPPSVSVSQPVFDDNGMYSVDVKGVNIPEESRFYYVMLSHFDKKLLQKSEDGHFSNIPFCEDDGHSYDFAIMDSRADTLCCVPVEQTGFIKQRVIDPNKKMTQEQLQKLIDTQSETLNGVGESDYLAPDYQLQFSGIPSDMKQPESWTELFELIEFGAIEKATVTQVDYDDMNRINVIKLKVVIP